MIRKFISIFDSFYRMVLKVINCIVELSRMSRKFSEWLVKVLMFLVMCWLGLLMLVRWK